MCMCSMPVKSYTVRGNDILVGGAIAQTFTVIDLNTVSYDTGGAGIKNCAGFSGARFS